METGFISSIETMGLVDGPGIRYVVFMSGCALRCGFCHNPNTWQMQGGMVMSDEELLRGIKRFMPYFTRSGGGVTFSGGEPLLQPRFLLSMLKRCREAGIHTCLDTAGVGLGEYDEILKYTDLVLYDVKATTPRGYRELCERDISETEAFQKALIKWGGPVIVRQVVIPTINDTPAYMQELATYIKQNIPTARGVELLPYHKMGVYKYKELGLVDPMAEIPPMDRDVTNQLLATYFGEWNSRGEENE